MAVGVRMRIWAHTPLLLLVLPCRAEEPLDLLAGEMPDPKHPGFEEEMKAIYGTLSTDPPPKAKDYGDINNSPEVINRF